ncbi:hypothetical protein B0H13DRAFT_2366918 [Mycena leptocephala]|nr:hypothetical protein B0H13DRAFT_2366918 [Mycena leptocephala]
MNLPKRHKESPQRLLAHKQTHPPQTPSYYTGPQSSVAPHSAQSGSPGSPVHALGASTPGAALASGSGAALDLAMGASGPAVRRGLADESASAARNTLPLALSPTRYLRLRLCGWWMVWKVARRYWPGVCDGGLTVHEDVDIAEPLMMLRARMALASDSKTACSLCLSPFDSGMRVTRQRGRHSDRLEPLAEAGECGVNGGAAKAGDEASGWSSAQS